MATYSAGNSETTISPIVVVGGGITGMAIAIMLAKLDLPVTVLERDSKEVFMRSEVFPATRTGAVHASRPHALRAGGRDLLRRSLPEVLTELYAQGARDAVELPGSADEEHLTVLIGRRLLLERALASSAASLPSLRLRFGERVRDLVMTDGPRPSVSGVVTSSGMLPAQLVIDASGKRGKALSRFGPPQVSLRSRIYYTSRPFRLSNAGFANTHNAAAVWIKSPTEDIAEARLFMHDHPYASLLVSLYAPIDAPSRDQVLRAYQSVLSVSGLRQYFEGALPLAPIQIIGFLRSTISLLSTQQQVVTGVHHIGDALLAIDPLSSKGITMGLIQAEVLANVISSDVTDYDNQRQALLSAYHEWLVPPWSDALLRGRYLRKGDTLPQELAEHVAVARRRALRQHEMLSAARRSPAKAGDAALIARIRQLQVPASAIDTLKILPPGRQGRPSIWGEALTPPPAPQLLAERDAQIEEQAAEVVHFDEPGFRTAGKLAWVHSTSAGTFALFTMHARREPHHLTFIAGAGSARS